MFRGLLNILRPRQHGKCGRTPKFMDTATEGCILAAPDEVEAHHGVEANRTGHIMRRQCDGTDALDHRLSSFQAAGRAVLQRGYTMTETLAEKTCTPCRGGIPPLTLEAAEGYRAQAPEGALAGWARGTDRPARSR